MASSRENEMLVLTAAEVDALLDSRELDAALRHALRELSAGRVDAPPRVTTTTEAGRLHVMPGYLPGSALCVKAVTVCMDNAERGIPTHQGAIMVFDENDGRVKAVRDGTVITDRRTAATAAIAADLLARNDATVLTVVGAGAQGRAHLEAFAQLRPWQEVRIAARNLNKAESLAQLFPAASATDDISGAVRGADVVCLCTDAADPVIERSWLSAGCHVSSIGRGHEIDTATLDSGRIFIEWAGAATYPPPAGTLDLQGRDVASLTEIGAILAGDAHGRSTQEEITIYKSTGHAVEDAAAARVVLDRAAATAQGHVVAI
jgi:ornithine cyclodeaminase/alanine dehydrogenase-like protein (mu-crystallin family)